MTVGVQWECSGRCLPQQRRTRVQGHDSDSRPLPSRSDRRSDRERRLRTGNPWPSAAQPPPTDGHWPQRLAVSRSDCRCASRQRSRRRCHCHCRCRCRCHCRCHLRCRCPPASASSRSAVDCSFCFFFLPCKWAAATHRAGWLVAGWSAPVRLAVRLSGPLRPTVSVHWSTHRMAGSATTDHSLTD